MLLVLLGAYCEVSWNVNVYFTFSESFLDPDAAILANLHVCLHVSKTHPLRGCLDTHSGANKNPRTVSETIANYEI